MSHLTDLRQVIRRQATAGRWPPESTAALAAEAPSLLIVGFIVKASVVAGLPLDLANFAPLIRTIARHRLKSDPRRLHVTSVFNCGLACMFAPKLKLSKDLHHEHFSRKNTRISAIACWPGGRQLSGGGCS